MGKPRNVGREIAVSLGAAVVLGSGFAWWLMREIEASRPEPPKLTQPSQGGAGARADAKPSAFDAASELVTRFATALAEKRHADAYALMAPAYRSAVSLEAFTAKCTASPFLSGVTSASIVRTRQTVVDGSSSSTYTLQGQGMLVTGAGSIDATFVFLADGGKLHLLVLTLASIPVLDGISGAAK